MDKLLAAAASVVIAYVMPVGARAAAANIVVAAASDVGTQFSEFPSGAGCNQKYTSGLQQ